MKPCRFLTFIAFFMMVLMTFMINCEFDVTQPKWYEPPPTTKTVTITGIDPGEAAPGVNYITLTGTNLTGAIDTLTIHSGQTDTSYQVVYNGVYFDRVLADVVAYSATSIKVRRPNLVSDACTVKIVSDSAFLVAKYPTPYKIAEVRQAYGSFLDNVPLAVVAVDGQENLFIVETNTKYIYKVTPAGDKTIIGTASRVPMDGRIGPDGNFYLAENNRAVDKVDLTTGAVSRWVNLPSGKVVKFCEFDQNGYFYAGGTKTDLVVMPFNQSATAKNSGFYASQEILALRCYSGYIYVASRTSSEPLKIWKHAIGAGGALGAQELALDMSSTAFAGRMIKSIAFNAKGEMFLATDSPDPVLIVDPVAKTVDYYYKAILPGYCKYFSWGSKTFNYLICGDTDAQENWLVYRVDMGAEAGQM